METPTARGAPLVLAGPPRASSGLSAPRLGGLVAPGPLARAQPEALRLVGPVAADPNCGVGRERCNSRSGNEPGPLVPRPLPESTFKLREYVRRPKRATLQHGSGGDRPAQRPSLLDCTNLAPQQASPKRHVVSTPSHPPPISVLAHVVGGAGAAGEGGGGGGGSGAMRERAGAPAAARPLSSALGAANPPPQAPGPATSDRAEARALQADQERAEEEAPAAQGGAAKAREEVATAKEEAAKAREEASTALRHHQEALALAQKEAAEAREEVATAKEEAAKAREEASTSRAQRDVAISRLQLMLSAAGFES